jgi:hypothetical protein
MHIVVMLDIGMVFGGNPASIKEYKVRVHREALGAYKITKKLLHPPTSLYQRTKRGGVRRHGHLGTDQIVARRKLK